ncbi:MAG: PAS domain-containing protein [Gemmataceae bacterium]|nr:PAS domain-containing protein [Gemmataceae bacterium]MDW8264031.1 chemotaxis protein CheB [Gemmataceae bacterium]
MTTDRLEPPTAAGEANQGNGAKRPLYVVGIGASAGGLEALERFFEAMPLETGLAFVVVQHLSPDFKSLMDELLARKTAIPIHRAADGMIVEPNAIYLIPPKKDMIIANGRLLLTDKDPKQLVTLPIDRFFRSLAQDLGDRAIAVVLSGTGSDGSRGIRDVHEAGGLVIVQSPETAKFDGMPNSARQTGAVDLVLPPEEMPAALVQYVKQPFSPTPGLDMPTPTLPERGYDAIFRLLRDTYGIDFSHYKSSTVGRRIERRLLLNRVNGLDDYVAKLRSDPAELDALYRDLLIGVTRFFRDAQAFERLAQDVLPGLLLELPGDEELRVWVAGCATGEEAYSLAILIRECAERLNVPVRAKIFATDVHRASLDVASLGLYSDAQLSDVSPERLRRYFVRKGDGWQVSHDLRQMVVFAPHNAMKDAPFTKLDLISCRNLLIYFQPTAQKKVLSLFHFGLKTGGVLFLGPSESPGELADEFTTIDPHWKIYRKRRDIRLPAEMRLPLSAATVGAGLGAGARSRPAPVNYADQNLLNAYDVLLDDFLPPSVLINENRQVIQTFNHGNRYLHLREGRFSADILDMVDAELRILLGGALPRAWHERTPVSYKGLRLNTPEGERIVDLTIRPVAGRRSGQAFALVIFSDDHRPTRPPAEATQLQISEASRERLEAIESELRFTKENLQATIEELETSNEELQATNEELVASNEELQSTNEELHSVNEELYTVNAEYQKKITELLELTSDMDNLLQSTQVHTLFLDRNLCIRKFTPCIAETFNLLPQDIGRRIDHFTYSIDQPALVDDMRRVMETGQPLEQQVRDRRGRWFLLRILPYRCKDGIGGIVLTLIDLSNVKRAEAEARAKDRQLSAILDNSPQPIVIKDLQGRYLITDRTFQELVGRDPTGLTAYDLFPPAAAAALSQLDRQVIEEGKTVESEVVVDWPDGAHTYLVSKFPLRDENGQIVAVGGIKMDVTRLKRAEQQAREALEQRDRFLAILSHELRNPLGAISNAAELLSRPEAGPAAHAEAVSVLQRQTMQMSRLLDDLLDIARITQNKIQLRRAVVPVASLVEEAVRVVHPMFQAAQVALEVRPAPEPLWVNGDAVRLQQLLVNLLMNAVKYTPPGGRVTLEQDRAGNEAVIHVRDTGVGLRPDMLERVFDLFVQADETLDRSGSGLGVGLTLVRSVAELHGGRVRAFSEGPGKGSVFTVWLPLTPGPSPAAQPPPRPPAPKARILIVEDNDDSRRMLETMLRLDGHEVTSVADGHAGLEALLKSPPDVALIDVGLPGLNGFELAREARRLLRLQGQRVYLVALTGYGRVEDRQEALEAGFDQHLVKPLRRGDLDELFQRLSSVGAAVPSIP